MQTQRDKLQKKIKDLEYELSIAIKTADAFIQLELFKKLEIAKSTLLNLD